MPGPGIWDLNGVNYVGSNVPAFGSYVGQIIQVDNAAVPAGRSIIQWTGALWAPPAGELIAGVWRGASPVAAVTPGTTAVSTVWEGPVVPDYMVPSGVAYLVRGVLIAKNASGTSGALGGIGLASNAYTLLGNASFPVGFSVTPDSSGQNGGIYQGIGSIIGSSFRNGNSGNRSLDFGGPGAFVSGQTKLRAVCKPSSTTDQFVFDGANVISEGCYNG